MRDDLAERLLGKLLDWDGAQLANLGGRLQILAALKYDEYELYRPGEHFLESLARWLAQFSPEERKIAIRLVLEHLIFVSRAELDHSIAVVYPHIVRPALIRRAGAELGLPPFRVAAITQSPQFVSLHRATLILGLADGARLDRLRRTSDFSHEQFEMGPKPNEAAVDDMVERLRLTFDERSLPGPPLFRHVLLIDDFSGSGFTLLREKDGNETFSGKLWKVHQFIESGRGVRFADDVDVSVVLYVASQHAVQTVEARLKQAGLEWSLSPVQLIANQSSVTDQDILGLSERYYDPALEDEHKRKSETPVWMGFGGAALPLVLHHNTPNNSISLLWADTSAREDSSVRFRALFPRYERHLEERG